MFVSLYLRHVLRSGGRAFFDRGSGPGTTDTRAENAMQSSQE